MYIYRKMHLFIEIRGDKGGGVWHMVMNNWMLVQYTNLFHPLSFQNLIMSNKRFEEILVKLYLNHFPSFYVKKKTINGVTTLKMVIISNIIYIDLSIYCHWVHWILNWILVTSNSCIPWTIIAKLYGAFT